MTAQVCSLGYECHTGNLNDSTKRVRRAEYTGQSAHTFVTDRPNFNPSTFASVSKKRNHRTRRKINEIGATVRLEKDVPFPQFNRPQIRLERVQFAGRQLVDYQITALRIETWHKNL